MADLTETPNTPKREGWTIQTVRQAQEALRGERRGLTSLLPFIGPAVIASVAYEDPGNFATNIQGGAQFGYMLLWVVLGASLMAILFQALSAKLGIVTEQSLASLCRKHFPRPLVWCMWVGSEFAAMATDLAEFLGAAIGLTLLFGLPILVSFVLVGIGTYAVLTLQRFGFRPLEAFIGTLVGIISICYLAEIFISKPNWGLLAYHSVVPQLAGSGSLLLAVGIVGATVMPHAIYLHSSLTQNRIPVTSPEERKKVIRFSNWEVVIALGAAGLVNMAMLAMAAAVFYATGNQNVADIMTAYRTLVPLLGGAAAGIFLLSLLASGFSSSVVGTLAGQGIMQDFVRFRIPIWVRRLVTMVPPFFVILLGVNATQALVVSQVVLSIILPIPLIALIILTSRKSVMGDFANKPLTNVLATAACALILCLNLVLIAQVAGVSIQI